MHKIPKGLRKYFKFKFGLVHTRKGKLQKTTKKQENALHTLKIRHKHVYKDIRNGKLRKEMYY